MKHWHQVADTIAANPGLTMLLGASDRGKTTFATALANRLCQAGLRVAVVDGDVGQSDIGPPGTVGMGMPTAPLERIAELPFEAAYFVGSNSPEGHSLSILVGLHRMVTEAQARGAEVVIVDTTGLVHGRSARVLKHFKLELLRPRYLVALQLENELEHILKPFELLPGLTVIRTTASVKAQPRSRHRRKLVREKAFAAHLAGGSLHRLGLDRVRLLRTIYGSGRPLPPLEYPALSERLGCDVVYAEWIPEGLYLVLDGSFVQGQLERLKEHEGVDQIYTSRVERFQDLLVGLTGDSGEWLGIGVLTGIDFIGATAGVFTPVEPGAIRAVHVGILRVSSDGQEMGKIFPNDI